MAQSSTNNNTQSNTNNNPQNSSKQNIYTKRDVLGYNLLGLNPIRSIYHLEVDTVKKMIEDICRKEISDVKELVLDVRDNPKRVEIYLWFNADSKHFIDKSFANNSMLPGAISRLSDEIKAFCLKYGWRPADDNSNDSDKVIIKNIIYANKEKERCNCVRLAISPFIIIAFDGFGNGYNAEFGKKPPRVKFDKRWEFESNEAGKKKIVGLTVEKYIDSAYKQKSKLIPKKIGRF